MPNILHRLSIDASPERVHQLTATREGIQRWWTGHPITGDDTIGGQLSVYFSDPGRRDQPLGGKHQALATPGPVASATSSPKARTRAGHMI